MRLNYVLATMNGCLKSHPRGLLSSLSCCWRSATTRWASTTTEPHGGQLVAQVLRDHDVRHIFTLVGGHISPLLVEAENIGIRVVDCRHEVSAVFAADAAARLRPGSVGVAAVTAGPGLTNAITAAKNALMAETPLLLLGGATATLLKGRGALQDIDQKNLFNTVCKWQSSVKRVRDIVPTLRKAMQVARTGTPGPVFIELPVDTLYPASFVEKELGSMSSKAGNKSLVQNGMEMYLRSYSNNLFAGAFDERNSSPLPAKLPPPPPSKIATAASALSAAKAPLFLVGSQAVLEDPDEVRRMLQTLGIPCYLSGMARGILGRDSEILLRHKRRDALREADVVVLLGGVCDFRLNYGRSFHPKTKVIVVNRDVKSVYKNAYIFWKPHVGISADALLTLRALKEALGDRIEGVDTWREKLKERDRIVDSENREKAERPTASHLNPLHLLHKLEDELPDDSVIVADGGDFVATASYILRPRGSLRWLDPGPFGTLGVGAGFALGAKMVRPDSQVLILYGDGSLGYSLVEFDTFRRFGVDVVAIVGNDAGWTQISREQVPIFGRNTACALEHSNYHLAAEAFGARGFLLDNPAEVRPVLKAAFETARTEKRAVLVNALIGETDFRAGSIAI